jgi:hypothetical protein
MVWQNEVAVLVTEIPSLSVAPRVAPREKGFRIGSHEVPHNYPILCGIVKDRARSSAVRAVDS